MWSTINKLISQMKLPRFLQKLVKPSRKSNDPAADTLQPVYGSAYILGNSSSAAEIIGGYDEKDTFPNLYDGSANIAETDKNTWPAWSDPSGAIYSNNPLIHSREELDSKMSSDTIEDYWIRYESDSPDPYTGGSSGNS